MTPFKWHAPHSTSRCPPTNGKLVLSWALIKACPICSSLVCEDASVTKALQIMRKTRMGPARRRKGMAGFPQCRMANLSLVSARSCASRYAGAFASASTRTSLLTMETPIFCKNAFGGVPPSRAKM